MGDPARLRGLRLVLVLSVLSVGVPVSHQPLEAGLAFHDKECPLVRLASCGVRVGLPRVDHLIGPLPVVPLAVHPPLVASDSRPPGSRSRSSEALLSVLLVALRGPTAGVRQPAATEIPIPGPPPPGARP
jgi:hypothetical protein